MELITGGYFFFGNLDNWNNWIILLPMEFLIGFIYVY